MKPSIYLQIAAAFAAAPLFLATAALAETSATYSPTAQSDLVLHAIDSLRAGNLDGFRAQLDESALNLYGNEQSMHDLRDRFEHLSGGAGTSAINTRTEVGGTLKADTLLLVSNRVYSVEVVSGGEGAAPIWNVSVHCIGASVFDSFGLTDYHCRITDISASPRSRDGTFESQGFAGVHGRNLGKQLSDDTPLTSLSGQGQAEALSPDAASGARVPSSPTQ